LAVGEILSGIAGVTGIAGNRPIGLDLGDSNAAKTVNWPVIALTGDQLHAFAVADNGYGPGIYRFEQTDPAGIGGGSYEFYCQISEGAIAGQTTLRAANGMYVCAEGGGGQEVVANRTAASTWETFNVIDLGSGQVALQVYNGMYVCAEGGGGREVVANRGTIGAWETFKLIDQGSGLIALQASNGMFVSAEGGGGGAVVANRTAIGGWERFAR
jgi:hypothetical protein